MFVDFSAKFILTETNSSCIDFKNLFLLQAYLPVSGHFSRPENARVFHSVNMNISIHIKLNARFKILRNASIYLNLGIFFPNTADKENLSLYRLNLSELRKRQMHTGVPDIKLLKEADFKGSAWMMRYYKMFFNDYVPVKKSISRHLRRIADI